MVCSFKGFRGVLPFSLPIEPLETSTYAFREAVNQT